MFDIVALASVDPYADEAELIAVIADLERLKSAAAAGQARATAALDKRRRVAEAAAGVPAKHRGRGCAVRLPWRGVILRRAETATWASPRLWCLRCRTPWLLWNAVHCPNGVPP